MKEGSTSSASRRKPVVAAVLSVLTRGLGQVYNGQAIRGAALWAALPCLFLAVAWSGFLHDFSGLSLTILACLCIYVYTVADAFLGARRRQDYVLKAYNRWYIYAVYVGVTAILSPGFRALLPLKSYRIPTGSMEPAVRIGDHILVDLKAYSRQGPERGHIIAFRFPNQPDRDFLQRVVVLPGERFRIINKTVYINGEPLDEPYAVFSEPGREPIDPRADNVPEDRIPEGYYLTLGDNRDSAHDGRFWGYVPAKLIRGRAMYVYWSTNLARIGRDFQDR